MSGFDEHLKVVLDGYSNFLSSRELSDPQHHPGWDLEMGVVFNSCETGTICSSICNEKREKFFVYTSCNNLENIKNPHFLPESKVAFRQILL